MSFQQALSGLNGASAALDTISNNVANSSTVGFKQSQTQFADLFASSLSANGTQIGTGTSVVKVAQQFVQGSLTSTNNPLDMAINGQGFFPMQSADKSISYTRNGQFQLDKSGSIINASGLQLTGYPAVNGVVAVVDPAQPLSVSTTQAAQTTKASTVSANLSSLSSTPLAMTAGGTSGFAAFGTTSQTVTISAASNNNKFAISVDGSAPVNITLPDGTYTGGQGGTLLPAVQTALNSGLANLTPAVSAKASIDSTGNLVIKSGTNGTFGTLGTGSSVAISGVGGNSGTVTLFGTATTGTALLGTTAATATVLDSTLAPPTNQFTIAINGGTPMTVTIPGAPTTYTGGPTGTLLPAVKAAVSTALTNNSLPTSAVSVSLDATGHMVLSGTGTIQVSEVGGGAAPTTAGALTLFGLTASTTSPFLAPAVTSTATGTTLLDANSAISTMDGTTTDNQFFITINGAPTMPVSIATLTAPATYTGGPNGTLLPAVKAAVSAALAAASPALPASAVNVSMDTSNHLVFSGPGMIQVTDYDPAVGLPATVTGAATLLGSSTPAMATAPVTTPLAAADNFSPLVPTSYTSATSQQVYDTGGNAHTLSLYYVKTAQPDVWQVYTAIDGQPPGPTGSAFVAQTLQFAPSGALSNPGSVQNIVMTNAGNTLNFSLDLSGSTENTLGFGVNKNSQDGFAAGALSGITVASDGTISGTYNNGAPPVTIGQVVLVNFTNPNGLVSLGNNEWQETVQAGKQPASVPGKGSVGALKAGTVEESNVDLTKELVNMITQQRAYQANAQSIKTEDSIMQTLVSLR